MMKPKRGDKNDTNKFLGRNRLDGLRVLLLVTIATGLSLTFVSLGTHDHQYSDTFNDHSSAFLPLLPINYSVANNRPLNQQPEEGGVLSLQKYYSDHSASRKETIQTVPRLHGTSRYNNILNSTQNYTLYDRAYRSNGKYAYVYFIGGCHPDRPQYRNYFYNVLISTFLSRRAGSKAEVVLLFQISAKYKSDTLPLQDTRIMDAMHIKYEYMAKSKHENFYLLMMDKFRVFNMTQYDRIIMMDSDVISLGNQDYMFHLSKNGVLNKNVVLKGRTEPANGGWFMITPEPGDWERVLEIIDQKEAYGEKMGYPHWNQTLGWGHVMVDEDDYWEDVYGQKSQVWNMHGAHADQGLLWHYLKYVKKDVMLLGRTNIDIIGPNENDKPVVLKTVDYSIFEGVVRRGECGKVQVNCRPPRSDHFHFTSSKKPWLIGPPLAQNISMYNIDDEPNYNFLWFNVLALVDKQYNMSIDFDNWKKKRQRGHLGNYPKYSDLGRVRYKDYIKGLT